MKYRVVLKDESGEMVFSVEGKHNKENPSLLTHLKNIQFFKNWKEIKPVKSEYWRDGGSVSFVFEDGVLVCPRPEMECCLWDEDLEGKKHLCCFWVPNWMISEDYTAEYGQIDEYGRSEGGWTFQHAAIRGDRLRYEWVKFEEDII